MSYTLGNITADFDPLIQRWKAAVEARGHATTLMPAGAYQAEPAERWADLEMYPGTITKKFLPPAIYYKGLWYSPAPSEVRERFRAQAGANTKVIARQAMIDRVQGIPGDVLTDAGKLARTGVSALTGIPTWAIPVLLIGGGAFILMSATHSLLPDRRK